MGRAESITVQTEEPPSDEHVVSEMANVEHGIQIPYVYLTAYEAGRLSVLGQVHM